jgi:lipid-A-disaccharide synthase-like uncharacterized protein
MKKIKVSMIFNFIIFVLVLLGTIFMVSGIEFMKHVELLSVSRLEAFKYFTVDSNVFAGLVSLAYVIYKLTANGKKRSVMPRAFYILKLAAATGVTLTMMVTVFYLAPTSNGNFLHYFLNSNFFMHLITPLLCIISFIFFEVADPQKLIMSVPGIIPMLLYSFFYTPNVLLHLDNGKVVRAYDWYNFLAGGAQTVWIVVPVLYLITWIFALGLWALNRKLAK